MKGIIAGAGIVLIALIGCKQRDNVAITRNKDGIIISEIPYLKDSVTHGLAKYYYDNGDLKGEVEYFNGKREGWHRHYTVGEIVESRIHYKNDLEDGEAYWYYPNGKLKSKSRWIDGKNYGNLFVYYENGSMKAYNCKDHFGNTLYDIRWDSLGNKIKEEGVVFSPKFYFQNTDNAHIVKANQEIVIEITVAEPPEAKATIWMGEVVVGGKIEDLKTLPIENNTTVFKYTFKKTGKHTLITSGELGDTRGKVIKKDRVTTDITVVE